MSKQMIEGNQNLTCEELWGRLEPDIRKICKVKLSSHPDEVEDAVMDVFTVFWEAQDSGKEIQNIDAWMFGVTNNIIKTKYSEINTRKKRLVSFEEKQYDLSYSMDMDEPNIPQSVIDEAAKEIMAKLTDEERYLVEQVNKKVSYKKLSKKLGKSATSLKQKHYRAVRMLKLSVKDKMKELENIYCR